MSGPTVDHPHVLKKRRDFPGSIVAARRRPTRIHHATADPHLFTCFQKMEQGIKIQSGSGAGVEGDVPPVSLSGDFKQVSEADAARVFGNKFNDLVTVDGDGV